MISAVARFAHPERPTVAFPAVRDLARRIVSALIPIALTLLAGLAPRELRAQAPVQVPAQAHVRQDQLPAVALAHCVERLKSAINGGDGKALEAAIQDVELLRRTYGTMDLLPLVEAMSIYARGLGNAGSPDQGLKVLKTVERWGPRSPVILGARVVLLRQRGPQGYFEGIVDVLELTRLRLANPLQRWLWTLHHTAWLRLMATLLLWGWALALAVRYRNVFRDLWEAPLRKSGVNPHVIALAGAFLVCLPVVFGLDPSLVAMVSLWLLAPFLLGPEIKATLFILLFQLVHPALYLCEPLAAARPKPSLVALQLQPTPATVDETIQAQLPPLDRTFLEGWRQLEFQDWAKAEATFASLAKAHPDHAEVMNNLGVARYQLGDVPGAQKCFDEAAGLLPGSGEILLNQSVVAYRQMDGPLGFSKQEDARRLAPDTFNRVLAANAARTEQRAFALPLPDTPERIAAVARAGESRGATSSRQGFLDPVFLLNALLPLAAALAFYFRLRRSISEAHPSQCNRCGDAFHTTDSPDPYVCSRCHHLFVLKDGLHGESRKRKVEEVARFQTSQRWFHRVLAVVLPGTDRVLLGQTRGGLTEFAFLCFALGIVLATGRSARYPGEVLADPASIWMPLGLALLAVLFLRSWIKLLPRRG